MTGPTSTAPVPTDQKALIATSRVDPDVAQAMTIYERLQPLQDALGLKDLTVPEMQLFAMVAHHTGLDPFTKQIYAIKRGGKVTHQTGIDGYRSGAERTHEYAGSDEATYELCGFGEADSPKEHPSVARVVVHRVLANGHVLDQVGVARWHELKPNHTKPPQAYDFLDAMWWRMPFNQLAKCAEANGLRKAFPRVLGSVYITEEMQQADAEAATKAEAQRIANLPTAGDRLAARRAALEAQEADTVDGEATELGPTEAATDADVQPTLDLGAAPANLQPGEIVEMSAADFAARVAAEHLTALVAPGRKRLFGAERSQNDLAPGELGRLYAAIRRPAQQI